MLNNLFSPKFLYATGQEASEHEVTGWSREHESNPHSYDSSYAKHPHKDESIQNRPNFPHIDQMHFKPINWWELGL